MDISIGYGSGTAAPILSLSAGTSVTFNVAQIGGGASNIIPETSPGTFIINNNRIFAPVLARPITVTSVWGNFLFTGPTLLVPVGNTITLNCGLYINDPALVASTTYQRSAPTTVILRTFVGGESIVSGTNYASSLTGLSVTFGVGLSYSFVFFATGTGPTPAIVSIPGLCSGGLSIAP